MKPAPSAKLELLDENQKQELCEWILTPGLSYRLVKKMAAEEFKLEISQSTLSRFYRSYCVVELLRQRADAVFVTDEIGKEIERVPGRWDQATIDAIKQKSFEMAIRPGSKPTDVKNLYSLVLKHRDQEMNERKLKLLEAAEKKVREAEETTKNSTLSDEEKQQRMKEIFGLA